MSSLESSRLAFVDTLRLFAAALVVFQHLAERYPATATQPLVELGPGVMGVVLFFLISGYVIPFSVRNGLDPMAFLIRRLCRIYPLFLAAICGVAIGGWTGLLDQWAYLSGISYWRWAANLLLVQDFVGVPAILGVSWTLIIELIWYALFAVAISIYKERAALLLAIMMPTILVVLGLASLWMETRIPLGRPAMIYAAILGYQAYQFHSGKLSRKQLAFALGIFLAVSWFTNIIAFGIFTHPSITLAQALGPWTIAPLLFFVVLLVDRIRTSPLINSGFLPLAGTISYSIYLLHPIANAAADQYFVPSAKIPAALALTVILSVLGYRLVERPGIDLGRYLVNLKRSGLVTA
ncbi:acyltransferase [Sphingorhabdus sp. IMCC26285]|jgi:peptidoglycan/LPS O-acetylase OafA/YrhL|uniref:Acyltransferase n=1 Tax=Sphingorhabdus profundilacus TaxID=2509718 RepID=A0A6I4LT20_9SPHN|nr:acyltransferase [Sphingorhabdus profundilacus]MVZ96572.1 acyltransferase [Sphingorhabdus profundilacus]